MAAVEEEEDDFLNQLKQEELERLAKQEAKELTKGLTYTDEDGTVMEWDGDRKAYFPKIDADFIAQYQINYGATSGPSQDETNSGVSEEEKQRRYEEYWNSYYQAYSKEQPKMPTLDLEGNEVEEEENDDEKKKEGKPKEDKKKKTESDKKEGEAEQSGESSKWDPTSEEVYQYNLYYYGQEYADEYKSYYIDHPEEAAMPDWYAERSAEIEEAEKKKGKKKPEKGEKRKEPPKEEGWFEADQTSSTQIYITGLPEDVTEEEYQELCAKCGMIMFDPLTRKPKLKLYRDSEGHLKGDGLCTYIKSESVDLALNILDGFDFKGHHISVERAKFEMKGDFDPKKHKKKKLSNKAKQKLKEKQQRLFDWRPDKNPFERAKHERTVVLSNMFEVSEFESDPSLITELRADVRDECSKFGEIKKVVLYDRNPAGIITITFSQAEEADKAIAALNGRWFAKKKIEAKAHDGKTKYEIKETDEERDKRLKDWEAFLAGEAKKEAKIEADRKSETSKKSEEKKDDSCTSSESKVEVEDVVEPDGVDTGSISEFV